MPLSLPLSRPLTEPLDDGYCEFFTYPTHAVPVRPSIVPFYCVPLSRLYLSSDEYCGQSKAERPLAKEAAEKRNERGQSAAEVRFETDYE